VYKPCDTSLDRIVAIKILSDPLAADPQFRACSESSPGIGEHGAVGIGFVLPSVGDILRDWFWGVAFLPF
jgi:hypothetical protein